MKISVVTISFNQCPFIGAAIESVVTQRGDFDLEYIVVDPGSTDGSREVIQSYSRSITRLLFERDDGPADGLNKGFSVATGDVYCYLNSDDLLMPGALQSVVSVLSLKPAVDVVYGDGVVIDRMGVALRKIYSDEFSLRFVAHNSCVVVQPSTFIRSSAFIKAGGFNAANRSNWDGELLVDLALSGAEFLRVPEVLSAYRLHESSITSTGRMLEQHHLHHEAMRKKIQKQAGLSAYRCLDPCFRLAKHLRRPPALIERVRKGPVFGRTGR